MYTSSFFAPQYNALWLITKREFKFTNRMEMSTQRSKKERKSHAAAASIILWLLAEKE
jgi:hypothetical protein